MKAYFLIFSMLLLNATHALGAGEKVTVSAGPSTTDWSNTVLKQPLLRDTGIELVVLENADKKGATEVFHEIIEKKADIGLAPIPWSSWSKTLIDKKVATEAQLNTLSHRVLGKDALKVVASPKTGIKRKLSLAEVKQIFAGQIRSWKELGGADIPVEVYIVKILEGSNSFFKTRVMGNDAFSPKSIYLDSVPAMLQDLIKKEGGIGFTSKFTPMEGAVTIETSEEIGRPITAFTLGKPSPAVEKMFDYATKKHFE